MVANLPKGSLNLGNSFEFPCVVVYTGGLLFWCLTRAGLPGELVRRIDIVHVGLSRLTSEASGRLLMRGDSEGLFFGKTLVTSKLSH